jgi:NAD(P)-dependent dehydrogenase (short-subunit alcohol dehydrogenase family)
MQLPALPLEGRNALVTGAGQGIGKGIALMLAQAGANVIINDLKATAEAESVAGEIRALGRRSAVIAADVSNAESVDQLFAEAAKEFDPLSILVNNAGVQVWKPLLDLTENDWDRVIDTNLKGCFLCTQRAARHMRSNGGGSIINLGSGCNKLAFPKLSSYTASKGGIEMFTKVAAAELGEYAIRVNCVAPGAVEVERTKLEASDFAGTWAPLTPLRRIGTPLDVAKVVAFLASDQAAFVSGQTIWVDGGLFSLPAWPYENAD